MTKRFLALLLLCASPAAAQIGVPSTAPGSSTPSSTITNGVTDTSGCVAGGVLRSISNLVDCGAGFTYASGVAGIGTASATSGALRIFNSGHAFYTELTIGVQAGNLAYVLPTALGSAGEVLTDVAGNGVLSWEAGSGVTIGDTQVAYATSANTLGGDAGLIYDDTTDTLTATNIGAYTSTGRIALPTASVSAVAIGPAANTGLYARATSVLNIATGGVGSVEFNAGNLHLVTTAQVKWVTALNGSADVGVVRDAAGILRVSNGSTGIGALLFARNVEAVTTTKTPGAAESGEYYTNTGDTDGATLTLTNDPGVGLEFKVGITVAQTLTIVPSAGESLYANGAVCATSLTSATIGSGAVITAAVGGSGGIWIANYTGTWSCT